MNRALGEWLAHLERLHPKTIELGLARIERVWTRLGLLVPFPLITVGGTNGKGSTCAFLECMLRCAGYRVASYSSPHLLRYNERLRVNGAIVSDALLCDAFARVDRARGDIPLTFFEFGTLAAMLVFIDAGVDVAVMEVGLGGRLDAVNLFTPHCAVVTNIGIDHIDYLGPTRESIGFEKAGIFRRDTPAVCADRDPPETLLARARELDLSLIRIGRDFDCVPHPTHWDYTSAAGDRKGLPWPALRGQIQLSNAATALAALDAMRPVLPVDMGAIRRGLVEVELPGRFQVMPGRPIVVLDVAHNPDAAHQLARNLSEQAGCASTLAVTGMLRDKDIKGVMQQMRAVVDRWFLADLTGPRAAQATQLASALMSLGDSAHACYTSPAEAFESARSIANADDRIVVFGSFLTVAEVLERLHS